MRVTGVMLVNKKSYHFILKYIAIIIITIFTSHDDTHRIKYMIDVRSIKHRNDNDDDVLTTIRLR